MMDSSPPRKNYPRSPNDPPMCLTIPIPHVCFEVFLAIYQIGGALTIYQPTFLLAQFFVRQLAKNGWNQKIYADNIY